MKIDKENVEDEFSHFKKDELSLDEIQQLGILVAKHKIEKFKNRWWKWKQKAKKLLGIGLKVSDSKK